jgi:hypothetical protein
MSQLIMLAGGCNSVSSPEPSAEIAVTKQAFTPDPNRPNINNLSPQQRARLANAILDFITQPILGEHATAHDWHHPSNGELFFIRHHDYLLKLQNYLLANGFADLVPVPYWDPGTSIPPEFLVADPLVRQWPLNPNPDLPLPARFNDLCSFATASQLAFDLEFFHDDVHVTVGGAMEYIEESPGAPIFWLWHGFLDDIYHRYQAQCVPPPAPSPCPKPGYNCCGEWVCDPEACPIICNQFE